MITSEQYLFTCANFAIMVWKLFHCYARFIGVIFAPTENTAVHPPLSALVLEFLHRFGVRGETVRVKLDFA